MPFIFVILALFMSGVAFSEIATLPISERVVDVTLVKKLAHLSHAEAIPILRARGIRVAEFDQAKITSGIESDDEKSVIEKVIGRLYQPGITPHGFFFARGSDLGAKPIAIIEEDTILLKQDAEPVHIAHEFMHFLLHKQNRSYRQTEFMGHESLESILQQYKRWHVENYPEGFSIPTDADAEFFRQNARGVEAMVARVTLLAYVASVSKLDELDIHLYFYENISHSSNDLLAGGFHLVELGRLLEKTRAILTEIKRRGGNEFNESAKGYFDTFNKLTSIHQLMGHDYGVAYRKLNTTKNRDELDAVLRKLGALELMK